MQRRAELVQYRAPNYPLSLISTAPRGQLLWHAKHFVQVDMSGA